VLRNNYFLILLSVVLAVTGCVEKTVSEPKIGVAVWDLEDLSPGPDQHPEVGELLSGQIIETLGQQKNLSVVEREKLVTVLQELNIGSSELSEESTRLKIGRFAGAQMMIFGAYQIIVGQVRIDLRLVDVETGRVLRAEEKSLEEIEGVPGMLKAAKDAAAALFSKRPSRFY